jgi:FlaA1/EpsC-like NDP-sugar epimerase
MLRFNVKRLIAVGRGEFSIFNLIQSLGEYALSMNSTTKTVYRIADIRNAELMDELFAEYRPEIIFHAAAHKHVPLMEANEVEAMLNNVGGTIVLLHLSCEYEISEFVFISTDKAVHPSSVMGATKRIAEIITDFYHRTRDLKTAVVRFGNVIGSRGSVIPLFMGQIERGGPVTVTHKDVTRYFMSIPEATLLVINSAAFSSGGELFVLDMGRQYRVVEIADRLIELYGFRSDQEIKIEYTGLRPGEKMHEDLFYQEESLVKTSNEKIFILRDNGPIDDEKIRQFLDRDMDRLPRCGPAEVRDLIRQLVPEYGNRSN